MHDVVVVGAGPAGIAAASICAEAGRRVALIDQNARSGGQIWRHRSSAQLSTTARRWIERLNESGAEQMYSTTVVSIDAKNRTVTATQGTRVTRVSGSTIILATGARELFLPFPGWTLPWVVGAGGAQALSKEGLSFRDKRVVVAGSGPLLLPVAAALIQAGARVSHVLEQASTRSLFGFFPSLLRDPARLRQALGYGARIGVTRYFLGSWVERAHGTDRLERVTIRTPRRSFDVQCDLLCTGYGLVPSTELARLAGCNTSNGAVVVDKHQQTSIPELLCAGEAAGIAGVENAIAEGEGAARTALGMEVPSSIRAEIARGRAMGRRMESTFRLRGEVLALPDSQTIVCRCEDVREASLEPGMSWRELKLRTRIGMGACQGRVCGAGLYARFGLEPDDARMPVLPVSIASLMQDTETRGPRAR